MHVVCLGCPVSERREEGEGEGERERAVAMVSTRVYCPSNDPPERVPCSVVKPVVEAVETFLSQELGRSEVEVRIKLVNDALETQHSKQSGGERCRGDTRSRDHLYS